MTRLGTQPPGVSHGEIRAYIQSLDPASKADALALDSPFVNYMHTHHPSMPTWLIVQGFAPVRELPPQYAGAHFPAEIKQFYLADTAPRM